MADRPERQQEPDDGESYNPSAGRIYPHHDLEEGVSYRTWHQLSRHERWLARFDRESED